MSAQNQMKWTGLDELRRDLRALPDHLATEGEGIVLAHATQAFTDVAAVYRTHARTGNLWAGLDLIKKAAGRFATGAILVSRAPHVFIFEKGTKPRQTKAGAYRGVSPAHHVFRPTVAKYKAAMNQAIAAMLTRAGFRVSGAA